MCIQGALHSPLKPLGIHPFAELKQIRNIVNGGSRIGHTLHENTILSLGQRIIRVQFVSHRFFRADQEVFQLFDGVVFFQILVADDHIKGLCQKHIQPDGANGSHACLINIRGDAKFLAPHHIGDAVKNLLLGLIFGRNGLLRLLLRYGQGSFVHLLVLIQWDSVDLHGNSRHHVRRLALQNKRIQRIHIHRFIGYHIGRQELSAARCIKVRNGGILDSRELTDDPLHLGKLNTEAANLHLTVIPANKVDGAVGQEPHDVACPVYPVVALLLGKGIADKYLLVLLGTV